MIRRTSKCWFLYIFLMMLIPIVARSGRSLIFLQGKTAASVSSSSTSPYWISLRGGTTTSTANRKKYRAIQVQIAHRHGDRTPITSLRDEEFWASTLIPSEMLEKISHGTQLIRHSHSFDHNAQGRGPFGKLTQLGLLQMIQVGTKLREELWSDMDRDFHPDKHGNLYHKHIWGPSKPLHPKDIRVLSTDFARTIQSVQGVLVGFFPEGPSETIEIDCRHTSWMIPDPQPRRSEEQEQLEIQLATRPHMVEREMEMRPLAVRCTEAIRPILADGAFDMGFGVGEEDHDHQNSEEKRVLTWAQLAEITTCLKLRNLLPESITEEDQEAVSLHSAWRWFESLRHPRLAYLAMHHFTHTILHAMRHHETEPALTIYSGHDSTLIGLLCAFRLEQPSVWPEYGSYLKIELLEVTNDNDAGEKKDYVVRFYLNGSLLRSEWHGELREEIPLDLLSHYISTEGTVKAT